MRERVKSVVNYSILDRVYLCKPHKKNQNDSDYTYR